MFHGKRRLFWGITRSQRVDSDDSRSGGWVRREWEPRTRPTSGRLKRTNSVTYLQETQKPTSSSSSCPSSYARCRGSLSRAWSVGTRRRGYRGRHVRSDRSCCLFLDVTLCVVTQVSVGGDTRSVAPSVTRIPQWVVSMGSWRWVRPEGLGSSTRVTPELKPKRNLSGHPRKF